MARGRILLSFFEIIGQANLRDPDVIERFSEKNYPECFREYADLGPDVYIALKPGIQANPAIIDQVNKVIETMMGKIARPRHIHIVPDMPRTRSGKLIRRVLVALPTT